MLSYKFTNCSPVLKAGSLDTENHYVLRWGRLVVDALFFDKLKEPVSSFSSFQVPAQSRMSFFGSHPVY